MSGDGIEEGLEALLHGLEETAVAHLEHRRLPPRLELVLLRGRRRRCCARSAAISARTRATALSLELTHLLHDRLALLLGSLARREVIDRRVDHALHQRCALVVLEVALPSLSLHGDLLFEALLAKVADGMVVGVGEHALDAVTLALLLDLVHYPSAVSLHLVLGANSAEDDLGHPLRKDGPVRDAPDNLVTVGAREGNVLSIVHEP
mmetsp:Transcript_10742/g.27581  ORF Transcript_10742/g.27581 Transcript_10742/m.27581 type:complete len:207 (-) Transcript_10742:247-867(-)